MSIHLSGIICLTNHSQLKGEKEILKNKSLLTSLFKMSANTKKSDSCLSVATKTYYCISTTKDPSLLSDVLYSLALTALILLSIPACHPRLTPDNPHCNTVPPYIKECMGNIASWNVSGTHCQPTQRQGEGKTVTSPHKAK